MPGKSYCERHAARAYLDSGTGDDAGEPEIVEDTDTGRRYRVSIYDRRNTGRKWQVARVPIGTGGTQRRSPVASTAAPAVTAAPELDGAVRAPSGLAKPVRPGATS
jgi:hypothetical protein